jgi:hypothetical protein
MRWLSWLRRRSDAAPEIEALDIDLVAAEEAMDPQGHQKAIEQLAHHRDQLVTQWHVLEKQFSQFTPVPIRNIMHLKSCISHPRSTRGLPFNEKGRGPGCSQKLRRLSGRTNTDNGARSQ